MSPGTMEAQGFTNQREYDRIWALTKPASPDTVRKISGFLNKVNIVQYERKIILYFEDFTFIQIRYHNNM